MVCLLFRGLTVDSADCSLRSIAHVLWLNKRYQFRERVTYLDALATQLKGGSTSCQGLARQALSRA